MTLRGTLRLVIFGALLLVSTVAARAEKRVALVIGNDRYVTLPTLQKAANDAAAVGDTLSKLGFDVVRGRDLGRQAMIDKIAEFTSKLEAGDTAMFFYAGHGVAIGGVNYLVPTDTPAATVEARVRGASITEADVIAEIQARGARVAVLVIDACRDNPFPRSGTRMVGNTRGLAGPSFARGVFVLYSAGSGQTALDRLEKNDPNRNSVFTRVFVEHLAKPGVHLGDLAVEVREKVAEIALRAKNDNGEPEPHEQTPAYYDQTIGGRIFLAGRSVTVEERRLIAPPVVQPPPADEIAWSDLQNTRDVAALRQFTAAFPKSAHRRPAELRIASLVREQAAEAEAERKRLAAEQAAQEKVQREAATRAEQERKRMAAEQAARDKASLGEALRAEAERRRLADENVAQEKAQRDAAAKAEEERLRLAAEQSKRDSANAAKTETQVALMTPPAGPAPTAKPVLEGGALVMEIKKELKRVGCYPGGIDDKWATAKDSIRKFARIAKLSLVPEQPGNDLLDSIRGKTERVCPLECGTRESEKDGRCIAKSCPRGQTIGSDGRCKTTNEGKDASLAPDTKPEKPSVKTGSAAKCSQYHNEVGCRCAVQVGGWVTDDDWRHGGNSDAYMKCLLARGVR